MRFTMTWFGEGASPTITMIPENRHDQAVLAVISDWPIAAIITKHKDWNPSLEIESLTILRGAEDDKERPS